MFVPGERSVRLGLGGQIQQTDTKQVSMAQVFPKGANTLARTSLFCAVAAPLLLFYVGSTITRSGFNTKVDVPLDQPIPFSHEHHANALGIDCRYCHTTVEKTAFAGIPP